MDFKGQIAKAKQMIDAQMEAGKEVCVHVHSYSHVCRNAFEIDAYTLTKEKLEIVSGWYMLSVEHPLSRIEFETREKSPYEGISLMYADGTEVCIDLV